MVKKMGLYFVNGRFRKVAGRVELGSQPGAAHAGLVIDAESITTRMPPRDWHLRTRDFLDVRRHPEIRVTGERIEAGPGAGFGLPATFGIHGERREVELTGHIHGPDPSHGRQVESILLHLEGVLDRHDFGVRPRMPVEWIVGRQVHLSAELVLERES
jgi:polyisoprenoid-binding protein YceI